MSVLAEKLHIQLEAVQRAEDIAAIKAKEATEAIAKATDMRAKYDARVDGITPKNPPPRPSDLWSLDSDKKTGKKKKKNDAAVKSAAAAEIAKLLAG